jgi:MFS family permease
MKFWKWWILFLACMITFGSYYSFDFPSVLHNQLFRHFSESQSMTKKDFEFQFSLFYSLYSLPNMILPSIGGYFSDTFGNNIVMLWFGSLVFLGNILQSIACYQRDITMFLIGRFIFGLGAETLQVCANITIAKWFTGQELAFALGINLSICKLGGVLTAWVSPAVSKSTGVDAASLVVSLWCGFCFLLSVLLYIQEPYYKPEIQQVDSESSKLADSNGFDNYDSLSYSKLSNSDVSTHNNNQSFQTIELTISSPDSELQDSVVADSRIDDVPWRIKQIILNNQQCQFFHFSLVVWLIFALTFVLYGIFIPFSNISNAVILEIFFTNEEFANEKNEISAAW